jgi:AcrR family transcriptional regulator
MSDVKGSGKRATRAQETRRRIVEAARDLFLDQGYVATLVPEVADRAGVAVQTIYFTFGTKRALLKEVVDVVIAGDSAPVATLDRPWFQEAIAAETAETMLGIYVNGTCRVLARVAPILRVLDAAVASDPEVAGLWPHEEDPRHAVQKAAAEALVSKPDARPDLTAERTADILFGLLSPELYRLMVPIRGWSHDSFEEWVHDALRDQVLLRPYRSPRDRTGRTRRAQTDRQHTQA